MSESRHACGSEIALEELGPAQAERPVLPVVADHRDDQVGRGDPAPLLQARRELAVRRPLLLLRAPLLEDLDDGHPVGALEPEAGVLGDESGRAGAR
jgi:hypothetical protein